MDKKVFAEGMVILRGAFPQSRAEFDNQRTINIWWQLLNDLTDEQYIHGVTKVAKTCKYLPAIAEIREAALSSGAGDLETRAMLAWDTVKKAIKRYGYMDSVKFSDPVIHNVIKSVFGSRVKLCQANTEEEKFYRPQFIKTYRLYSLAMSEGKLEQIDHLPGQAETHNIPLGFKPPPVKQIGLPAGAKAITDNITKRLKGGIKND